MNLKCLFGSHKWVKFMGPQNWGRGEFMQKYKCERCGEIDKIIDSALRGEHRSEKDELIAEWIVFVMVVLVIMGLIAWKVYF